MLAAGMFISMLVAVVAFQTYNDRRVAEQRETSRQAACTLIRTVLAAYQEDPNPPVSKTRENLIEAWHTIGVINRCF
jgi:hypothetical protein